MAKIRKEKKAVKPKIKSEMPYKSTITETEMKSKVKVLQLVICAACRRQIPDTETITCNCKTIICKVCAAPGSCIKCGANL